ncbi:hypothetical protein C8R45DRAFT_921963 [Mycena sanguinolenta]|nr:hypothetical protein C8R45DRAFT_921963 [Mycena sanguinolenta]
MYGKHLSCPGVFLRSPPKKTALGILAVGAEEQLLLFYGTPGPGTPLATVHHNSHSQFLLAFHHFTHIHQWAGTFGFHTPPPNDDFPPLGATATQRHSDLIPPWPNRRVPYGSHAWHEERCAAVAFVSVTAQAFIGEFGWGDATTNEDREKYVLGVRVLCYVVPLSSSGPGNCAKHLALFVLDLGALAPAPGGRMYLQICGDSL